MKLLKEKKGVNSHVEMILSVVLFLVFVGVALYFFRPSNTSRLIDSSLDYATREIEKNTSTEVYRYSILINESKNENAKTFIISLPGQSSTPNFAVYDMDGNVIPSQNIPGTFLVKSEFERGRNFIYILAGKDITPYEGYSPDMSSYIGPPDYTLASTNKISLISEKRIKGLIERYNKDYDSIKKEFNLPNRADFGFELSLGDGNVIGTGGKNITGVDVFVSSKKVEILRENNKIEGGEMRIKIW